MQKLSILIEGNKFDINVKDEFVDIFRKNIEEDLSDSTNNTLRQLLEAYLKKSYELQALKIEIEELSERIDRS